MSRTLLASPCQRKSGMRRNQEEKREVLGDRRAPRERLGQMD
jgi:hypothetical protein